MASAAKDLRYRSNYTVSGSLAHDLDWEIRERELRHAGELPRQKSAPQPQIQHRTAQKAKVQTAVQLRERQAVSLTAVAGSSSISMT